MSSASDILGLILGGGCGMRLYPLTRDRAKPAVPIAGKYRLIVIPISNCINSGITRIAILDKNARLSPGVIIRSFPRGTQVDHDDWVVRDGIVVIPENTTLPGGTYIGPEQ